MKNNWEKEFDKEFPIKLFLKYDARLGVNFEKHMKSFISNLLAQEEANWMAEIHEQRTQLLEEVLEIVGEDKKDDEPDSYICRFWGGYNQAKSEIRDKLNQLKYEKHLGKRVIR